MFERILSRRRRYLCFAVLTSDEQNHLPKLAEAVSINESVNGRIKSLFPYLERDVTRSQRPLRMKTMRLEILDCIICPFLIEKKLFVLKAVYDVLINQLYPAPYRISPVFNALIIRVNPANSSHFAPVPSYVWLSRKRFLQKSSAVTAALAACLLECGNSRSSGYARADIARAGLGVTRGLAQLLNSAVKHIDVYTVK